MTIRDLGVQCGDRRLLDGIDLDIRAGELVALIGPNGAGKSTLLAALAGDRIAGTTTRGSIVLDDKPLAEWDAAALGRRRAVLTQDHAVGFRFRAADVVAMGREPWRRDSDDATDSAMVAASMQRTETSSLADRDVTRLSGGERSRVAVARGLCQETGILLLDEPIAALDLRHQVSILDVVTQSAQAGVAVVVVLHDITLAARVADRVVVLHDGRIRADGAPADVVTSALMSDVYGCSVDVLTHPTDGSLVVVPAPIGVATTALEEAARVHCV